MQTIKLRVNDKVYEKLILILKRFSKSEIEIISEIDIFIQDKNYLRNDLNEIDNGNANFFSMEELEDELEKVISRHEDNIQGYFSQLTF